MKWVESLLGAEERTVDWSKFDPALIDAMFGSSVATSGERITEETSLQVSAVFASIRVITEPISTLPVDTFIPDGDQRKAYKRRPVWLDTPNRLRPELTRISLIQQLMWSLLLWGDAFIAVYRDASEAVIGVDVLDPETVFVDRDMETHARLYWVGPQRDGLPLPGAAPLTPYDCIHIPGFMLPGAIRGLSVIKKAAMETIGLAKAAQVFGAAFFGNGATPGVVAEVPQGVSLSKDGRLALKQAWNDLHGGARNAHKFGVLTEGTTLKKVSLSPDEAQFLETRQFSVADIARFFGVPPHLIADASSSTSWGSGLAEQNVAFAQNTLTPWITRLEEGLTRLHRADMATNRLSYVKFNLAAYVRGTLTERLQAYKIGTDVGLFLIDECRAWEDLPPLPNGLGAIPRSNYHLVVMTDTPPAPPAVTSGPTTDPADNPADKPSDNASQEAQ